MQREEYPVKCFW